MNIGLIGLGAMGGAYAKHLITNNFNCYGIDIDKKNNRVSNNTLSGVCADALWCECCCLVVMFQNYPTQPCDSIHHHCSFSIL